MEKITVKWLQNTKKNFDSRFIPQTSFNPLTQGELCQEILDEIRKKYKEFKFIRTKKGFISKDLDNWDNWFELENKRNGIHIIIHDINEGWTKINMGVVQLNDDIQEKPVWGQEALSMWLKKLPQLKDEVSYDIEKNKKVKDFDKGWYNINDWPYAFQGIPEENLKYCNKNLDHVYSLDFHSAFPSALSRIRPDMAPVIEDWYLKRKINPRIKEYLNKGIGAFASEEAGAKLLGVENGLAQLRSEILQEHAAMMCHMKELLWERGCIILNLRIDSIKFMCFDEEKLRDLPYQGEGLGQWSYEFKDCRYRQFSTGKYQYIDNNGNHKVVLNGFTRLDKIKPRSEWTWDDLENCGNVKTWNFDRKNWRINIDEKKTN